MNAVHTLSDSNAKPVEDVVKVLETALRLAQSGELRSIVLCGSLTAHRTYTSFSATDLTSEIGNIEKVKLNMLHAMLVLGDVE